MGAGMELKTSLFGSEKRLGASMSEDATAFGASMKETGGGSGSNYEALQNKPKINGIELSGDLSSDELGLGGAGSGDKTYVYKQVQAERIWEMTHGLGKHPSVAVVDSAGSVVFGETTYLNLNAVRLTFSGAFSGQAFLN